MMYRSKDELVADIRRLAKFVDDNAEEIAGTSDRLADIDIWLRFPLEEVAYCTVTHEYR